MTQLAVQPTSAANMIKLTSPFSIAVLGDNTHHFNLYLPDPAPGPAAPAAPTRVMASLAGASIIHKLLSEISQAQQASTPFTTSLAIDSQHPAPTTSALARLWQPRPIGKLSRTEKTPIWRPTQSIPLPYPADLYNIAPKQPPAAAPPPTDAQLLVIHDDAAAFRTGHPAYAWPAIFQQPPQQLESIIVQSAAPLCQGAAWWHLTQTPQQSQKLIVIIPIDQVRRADVQISKGFSWERTAIDLATELLQTPSLADLRKVGHVIIPIQSDGALWMSGGDAGELRFQLIFDPQHMEGEWAAAAGISPDASELTWCFTAAIAAALALCPADHAIEIGIQRGLRALRLAQILGHGRTDGADPGPPIKELAQEIAPPKTPDAQSKNTIDLRPTALGSFGKTILPESVLPPIATPGSSHRWQILLHADPSRASDEPLYGVARRAAIYGLKALRDVPVSRFGKLTTADRGEIESLRGLKRLINDYQERRDDTKPLSIAVFGPPGSGKSFGIKQIAEQVLPPKTPFLEFNLSQFSDEKDLIGSFHQVRDKALEGLIPVVFWDEFDAQKYRWLQFLLAPMQDGKFQEGQLTHRIGRSIFVFAGATSSDFRNFGPPKNDAAAMTDFRLKKGPDFISRIHGSLDVLGPNRRQFSDETGKQIDDAGDVCFPVRRALLLRSMLGLMGEKENQRLDMDYGLLCALLEVDRYAHGSRSMEKIVTCLRDIPGRSIRRSSLPSDDVLQMNVDVNSFRTAMNRSRHFQTFAPDLARAIHDDWRRKKRADLKDKPFPNDVDFADLVPERKADNVAAAMRMPQILELAGLYLVPADSADQSANSPDPSPSVEPLIEMLAEEEHNLWMEVMLTNGWKPAPHKPAPGAEEAEFRKNKLQHCLVEFAKLDVGTQDYDRNLIRGYPRYAHAAGFRIIASLPTLRSS